LTVSVARHRTAIGRTSLSRPVALALEHGLLPTGTTFFDYGCGRGGDLERLAASGYAAEGWDPVHRPAAPKRAADVVNLGYVVNVIEDPGERVDALRGAWSLARSLLIVAARMEWDATGTALRRFEDGVLTTKGTFQKFFAQDELRDWIDSVLGVRSVAASPGVFFVFREDIAAQAFLSSRVRHRVVPRRSAAVRETLFDTHRDVLEPVIAFLENRGRAPEPWELPAAPPVLERFGSMGAAVALVRRAMGDGAFQTARTGATNDLSVYLALAAFGGRPKFSGLPPDVQLDVKAFYGSYKDACAAADSLLFRAGDRAAIDRACREAAVGKLTPEALYVHLTALPLVSPLLRVFEGCGRALAGTAEGTTLVKLHRLEPKVSYLAYPDFDTVAHPALATSVRADLGRLDVRIRDFRLFSNPPILHRKETFVPADYPGRERFARLTAQEERAGLLAHGSTIGTRDRWDSLLAAGGLMIRGHRLERLRPDAGS
jgi:DNA phosphorothioation-associated putative methyltransferase